MTAQQYIGKHCIIVVIDPLHPDVEVINPEEYIVTKPNSVNHQAVSLKDGKSYNVPRKIAKFVRFATADEIAKVEKKLPEGVRLGALITAHIVHRQWKFSKTQKFVVLAVNANTIKIIEAGGNDLNQTWNIGYAGVTGVVKP
jgi:hypothetical protein